jgi:uncharacterized protein (DUF2252 family)
MTLCALLLGALACGEDDRAAWLRSTLIDDNRAALERDPDLVAGKLAKMARGPFELLRGTARQFHRDLADGAVGRPTAYGGTGAALIALVGDPHPENLSSFAAIGGGVTADWGDFDLATYGPFHLDVWRLATALRVTATTLVPDDDALADAVARAAATGYAEEIEAERGGAAPLGATAADAGGVLADLLDDAAERGAAARHLDRYTVSDGVRRRLILGDLAPVDGVVIGERLEPLDDDARATVAALVADYRRGRTDAAELAVKAAARQLGVGVSSYPSLRFLVLVEGPSEALHDDVLLELKEVGDPIAVPGRLLVPERRDRDAGRRWIRMARELQADYAEDPRYGAARSGRLTVRVREVDGYQRNLDLGDLAAALEDDALTADDLLELATVAGRILARDHGHARDATGTAGLAGIAAALGGDVAGFADEAAAFAADYDALLHDDLARFRALLEREGPLLGWSGGLR